MSNQQDVAKNRWCKFVGSTNVTVPSDIGPQIRITDKSQIVGANYGPQVIAAVEQSRRAYEAGKTLTLDQAFPRNRAMSEDSKTAIWLMLAIAMGFVSGAIATFVLLMEWFGI